MTITYDEKKDAYLVSVNQLVNGERVRKRKFLPPGTSKETAERFEALMLDPHFLLRERIQNCIQDQPPSKGTIYAVKNAYLPGVVKIGMTCNTVYERLRAFNTAYPVDWQIVETVSVNHALLIERAFHSYFVHERISRNREFFKLDEPVIVAALHVADQVDGVNVMQALLTIGRKP